MVVELKVHPKQLTQLDGFFLHRGKVYKQIKGEYERAANGVEYVRVTAEELDVTKLSDREKRIIFSMQAYEHKHTSWFVPATID